MPANVKLALRKFQKFPKFPFKVNDKMRLLRANKAVENEIKSPCVESASITKSKSKFSASLSFSKLQRTLKLLREKFKFEKKSSDEAQVKFWLTFMLWQKAGEFLDRMRKPKESLLIWDLEESDTSLGTYLDSHISSERSYLEKDVARFSRLKRYHTTPGLKGIYREEEGPRSERVGRLRHFKTEGKQHNIVTEFEEDDSSDSESDASSESLEWYEKKNRRDCLWKLEQSL